MSKQTWIFLLVVTVIMVSVPQFLPQEQKNSYIYNEQRIPSKHIQDTPSTWVKIQPYPNGCTSIINGVEIQIYSIDGQAFECQDVNGYIEIRRPQ